MTGSTGNQPEWTKDNSEIPELVPGEYYGFMVSAYNSIGESLLSDPVSFIASTVPEVPGAPIALVMEKTYITIEWSIPYDGGDEIDNYEIDWKMASVLDTWDTIPYTATANSY